MFPGSGAGYGGYPAPPGSYPPGSYPPPPSNYAQAAFAVASVPPPYSPPTPSMHHAGNVSVTVTTTDPKGYYWIDWSAHRMVPPTAVQGGVDKDGCLIYVGRAYHDGDWLPAKVIPDRHVAYVPHGGQEHSKSAFQLLCEQRFDWVPSGGSHIPPGAVEGGRTNTGEPLYIGRVWHDGAHTVGKVHPSHNTCYIPYGGHELSFPNFEILVLRT